ncbi:MAG TPA: C2H2-type zinc finger protein [Candidatus Eisenbacteria bacterium]|jgi:uncharacterized C2H2 Zn-finger protein|nr:C2H2-type zinc finger protein [Candidatus Eisenbacteria bacterium]
MEQYRCPRCQAEFSAAEQLDRHLKQHAGMPEERPQPSPGAFRSAEEAGRRTGGPSSSPFNCPRCGAGFSSRLELDRHGRAQHLTD